MIRTLSGLRRPTSPPPSVAGYAGRDPRFIELDRLIEELNQRERSGSGHRGAISVRTALREQRAAQKPGGGQPKAKAAPASV